MPESLKNFIDHAVETQGYGNVSEYVRGLPREAQTREANARLEALLLEGLSSGKNLTLSPQFWTDLRADASRLLATSKAK